MESGREFTRRRNTSYNANVSFTLMGDHTHSAGKTATARNTSAEPEGLRTTTPEPIKETSVGLEMDWAWCAASYHDAPSIHARKCNHNTILDRNAASCDRVFLCWVIFLYIWYVYRLAAGTATLMLVYFPASFSKLVGEIQSSLRALLSCKPSLSSLLSGTSNLRRAVSQTIPRKIRCFVRCMVHFLGDMKYPHI